MAKPVAKPSASGRYVKVSKATVAAAKGRVVVAKKLGTQPSKATAKIAQFARSMTTPGAGAPA